MSRDGGDEVNQADAGGRVTFLKFHSYQQSQGGKYECRVYGPGNTSEKLPLLIGQCHLCIIITHKFLQHPTCIQCKLLFTMVM